ncbi:MAG: peptide-methionine (R)-S-oxide reductase [Acidobacteriota bacterium]
MRPLYRPLLTLFVLGLGLLAVPPSVAQKSAEQLSAALERALEKSDYAVKRRAAKLRDVSDPDWGGFPGRRSLDDWRQALTAEQFAATREKVVDEPFAGQFVEHQADGTFHCTCGNPLFHSHHKTASTTGYPTFRQASSPEAVATDLHSEWSQENDQIELVCSMCGAHLGHVHPGESPEDELSFRVNSTALVFRPSADAATGE